MSRRVGCDVREAFGSSAGRPLMASISVDRSYVVLAGLQPIVVVKGTTIGAKGGSLRILTCSPKTGPGVMRVSGLSKHPERVLGKRDGRLFGAKETLDETKATQSGAGNS